MKSEFIDALIVAHDVAKSQKADRHLAYLIFDWLPDSEIAVSLVSFTLYPYHKFCIKSIGYLFKGGKLRQSMREPLNS